MMSELQRGLRRNVQCYFVVLGMIGGWSCRSAESDGTSRVESVVASPESRPSRRHASTTASPRKILGRWAPATLSRSDEIELKFDPPTGFQAIFEEFTEDVAAFSGLPEEAREASRALSDIVVGRWTTYRMTNSVQSERCFVVGRHPDGSMQMISVHRDGGRQLGAAHRSRIEMLMNSESVAALIILVDAVGSRDPELGLYLPIPSSASKAPAALGPGGEEP